MADNQRIILKSRPQGWASEDNFELQTTERKTPADGQLELRLIYLSLDPYMRGRMNDTKSYVPPFQLNEVIQGGAVAEVTQSNHPDFQVGDVVTGSLNWETYSLHDGQGLRKLPNNGVPLSYYLGVLGMPGLTAYAGLTRIAELKEGETVFVSAAAGAVGSVVGQIAKNMGARVVGTAGSDEKVAYLTEELGFDAAFNYKTVNLHEAFAEHCPDGIDVNFENVGGDILEALLPHMNMHGRMAICGMIAQYNDDKPRPGPKGLPIMIGKRVKMQGFIVGDHYDLYDEFISKASTWIQEGKLKYRETISEGLESTPAAFIRMLKGDKIGKQLVHVGDDPA